MYLILTTVVHLPTLLEGLPTRSAGGGSLVAVKGWLKTAPKSYMTSVFHWVLEETRTAKTRDQSLVFINMTLILLVVAL